MMIFHSFLDITLVWDLIETWGFRVDDACNFPDIPMSPHKKITKPNITQPLKNGDFLQFLAITQVWDLIETWGFRVDDHSDFPDIPISPHKNLPNQISRNLLNMVIFAVFWL